MTTPAIEALRRDSVLFENAYSHVPLTLPSHASLLTGLLPPQHGVRSNLGYQLDSTGHPTLAQVLRGKGYATGAAISAYVLRAATGIATGFDFYEDTLAALESGAESAALIRRGGPETVRLALQWEESVRSRPFFLFVHIYEPHFPYEAPEPYRSRYSLAYDATIAAADAAVAALLDGLKRDGNYERTLIVLLSDHGEGLGDHGEAEHGILLYREALHVPLLVKLPGGARAGTRVSRPVGLVDVLPTITHILAVQPPLRQDGHDLFQPATSSAIYSETYYPRIHLGWSDLRSLIDARYHFIDGPRPELYDVARDPAETRPLSGAERTSAAMKQALDAATGSFNEAGAVEPEAAERLKALGYLSSGPATTTTSSGRANPRDNIGLHEAMKAGFRLVREGRDEAAVVEFRRLLAASPGLFDVQWELGASLMRLGRAKEAAVEFEKAMRLSPSLAANVALSLAEAQLQLGRLEAAEATARVALAANAARAHGLLAQVAFARHDAAGVEREAALAKGDPAAEQGALITRTKMLVTLGRTQDALTLLDAARAAGRDGGKPPFRDLDGQRGDLLARLGRNDEAEAALRDEIRNYPANSRAFVNLAILLAVMGRPQSEVVEALEAMYRASPGPRTARMAADAFAFMGQAQAAEAWRRRAASNH